MKMSAVISIENGEIKNRKTAIALFKGLKDGKYLIEINSHDKRTNPQNRYYFGLVIPLIQIGFKSLGHELTKDEVHEFLKAKFNADEIQVTDKETGEPLYESIPKSTTRLNKEDFAAYIEQIQRFAAEFLSIKIPDPGTQTTIEYEPEEERL